ncbi:hypothetical protein RE6C_01609 [Rhodopirellula europaea 6C]|uniref:Uncharacterized protein n=1 Tax=Rhodopirellula europaea 6C TaxID=1263867 RepID=M2B620_9BACT|nr:hypothetical protein RE6C_01609 [Rhodopirellula europaea 6C]
MDIAMSEQVMMRMACVREMRLQAKLDVAKRWRRKVMVRVVSCEMEVRDSRRNDINHKRWVDPCTSLPRHLILYEGWSLSVRLMDS